MLLVWLAQYLHKTPLAVGIEAGVIIVLSDILNREGEKEDE
jgi:hypothetical protein